MKVYNSTDTSIYLYNDSIKTILKPNESVSIDCLGVVVIELKHDYSSTTMSEKEIARDHTDDSVMSLLILSHKEPYFNLVLDCKYEITCTKETEIIIRKEIIRPIYTCSYDRLYPFVTNGTVKEISHNFREKKEFENHYLHAISSSNRKVITILLIILTVLSLPILLICFLVNWIIGLVVLIGGSIVLLIVYFLGMLISKLLCKADCALVFSDFESGRIIDYFRQAHRSDT